MSVAIIVQARMGSTRLPGKNLLPMGGQPTLAVLLQRLARCERANAITVATTRETRDDALVEVAQRFCPVYRGPEADVLRRYFGCTLEIVDGDGKVHARPKWNVIVRITADCPLTDPAMVDAMIAEFTRRKSLDYLGNGHPERTVPRGFDVEVLSFRALTRAHEQATESGDREHVTRFIHTTRPDLFTLGTWRPDKPVRVDGPNLSVDTADDYEYVRTIVEALPDGFTMTDVLQRLGDTQ
jgi:spore coat polysaccharide biosynthesis protein SpsF